MDPKYWYIQGVAYDFTPFVKNHPGGQYAIYLGRGQECGSLIHSYHLNLPPQSLMDKYRVPKESQPHPSVFEKFRPWQKFTYEKGGFFDVVKEEVKDYFKKTGKSHKADGIHLAMFFLNVVGLVWAYYNLIAGQSYFWGLIHGIFRAILVMQTTHGASHFAMSLNPDFNRWAYRLGTILIGLWSPKNWDLQHVVAHHVYTNEWPFDSDSGFPIKSILYNQRRFNFHKYQHIYMWIVYAFFIPLVMLNAIRELVAGRQVTFKMYYHNRGAVLEAWGCSLGGLTYLLMPYFFLPFWTALKLSLVTNICSSLLFSLQFVVNHEVDEIIDDKPHAASIDFGQFQLEESFTFCPDSLFSVELAGGLNTQVEHHLFPGVHYSHYRAISKIVRRVAAQFGLTYHHSNSWWAAVKKHYALLKNPPQSHRSKDGVKTPRATAITPTAIANAHSE